MISRLLASVLLVTGFTLLASPGPAVAQEALRLEDAVRQALQVNERSLKTTQRVRAAEGQVDRARAGFLPVLTAGAGGGLATVADRSGRTLSGDGALTFIQPFINLAAVPLFRQAQRQLESERWGAVEDRRVLAFDTARAFLVVLMSEQLLQVSKQRLERAHANQKNAEVRAQAQLTSTNDVSRAQLDTAAAARDVAQADGVLARARLDLGFLVGHAVSGPLAPPDRTTEAAQREPLTPDEAARKAELRRPDVRSAAERTAALRFFAQEPLYRLVPTLSLTGQVAFFQPNPAEPYHNETLQLNLVWTLFDAGARYGDRKTRVAQAESQALDEHLLRRSVANSIGLARASLKAAREAYRISGDAVAAGQRNTMETDVLYQQGLAKAIELVDANTRRFEAEVGRVTAKLAMEQAYLELRMALGLGPIKESGSEIAAPSGGAP